jgi:hypothetical protein
MSAEEKHIPFTESPLDAYRGAAPPPKRPEKKKPGRKRKVVDHTVKIIPAPVTLTFN